jgi:hypothetical protein
MSRIEFPLEALLNPVIHADRLPGIMVWVGPVVDDSSPNAFWLESGAPDKTFRLAWSREGQLMGDARWTFSQTAGQPSFDRMNGAKSTLEVDAFELKGPEFDKLVLHVDEHKERAERVCKFANTLTSNMRSVFNLDPVSWSEVKHFAKTEGAALSQALEIASLQTKLLGPADQSLTDHQRLAQSAKAAQFAKDPEGAQTAIQGGFLRRVFAGLGR